MPLNNPEPVSLPVADTTAIVAGSADATKLMRFEVDGLTTAVTRVVTPPDADIDLIRSVASGPITTTDATQTTLATIPIPDDTAVLIIARVIARRTNGADRGAYIRRAAAFREAAGAATLQGTVDTPFTRESSGPWNVEFIESGNNILIEVTGQAANTINWESEHLLLDVG